MRALFVHREDARRVAGIVVDPQYAGVRPAGGQSGRLVDGSMLDRANLLRGQELRPLSGGSPQRATSHQDRRQNHHPRSVSHGVFPASADARRERERAPRAAAHAGKHTNYTELTGLERSPALSPPPRRAAVLTDRATRAHEGSGFLTMNLAVAVTRTWSACRSSARMVNSVRCARSIQARNVHASQLVTGCR